MGERNHAYRLPKTSAAGRVQNRDAILLEDSEIKVIVVFDGAVLVRVMGAAVAHIVAQQMVGKRLSDLLDVRSCAITPSPR